MIIQENGITRAVTRASLASFSLTRFESFSESCPIREPIIAFLYMDVLQIPSLQGASTMIRYKRLSFCGATLVLSAWASLAYADVWGHMADQVKNTGDQVVHHGNEVANRVNQAKADAARDLQHQRDKLAAQLARIDQLRHDAEQKIKNFERLRGDVQRAFQDYQRYSNLLQSSSPQTRQEAYRALTAAGVIGSNKQEIQRQMNRGLSLVLPGKELDHIEEMNLLAALAESIATANPGPALVYLQQFIVETKQAVLQNIQRLPQQAQQKIQREFEMLFIKAIDKAIREGRPIELRLDGVSLTLNLATYNYWLDVRYQWPELRQVDRVLGVPVYNIQMENRTAKIPLPNTFQPYVQLKVNFTAR
jgi:hypothetical protein